MIPTSSGKYLPLKVKKRHCCPQFLININELADEYANDSEKNVWCQTVFFQTWLSFVYFLAKQNPRFTDFNLPLQMNVLIKSIMWINNWSFAELQLQNLKTLFLNLNKNSNKIFISIALILTISLGQSEAGWLKKLGKRIVS